MKLSAPLRLMRFHQPIGILLLLWPALMAIWVASAGKPDAKILLIFTLGVIIMRAVGCIINDLTDAKFDRHVTRTAMRPLTTGEMSESTAHQWLGFLLFLAAGLLAFLPLRTWPYALGALLVTILYPWMKRGFVFPQLILGIAFAFSIPMVFVTIQNHLPMSGLLLCLATLSWTLAYDTIYAKMDRKDDLKLGLKSTAIFFGKKDDLAIFLFQIFALLLFVMAGWAANVRPFFYVGIIVAFFLTMKQQKWLQTKDHAYYLKAFLNNAWWGAWVWLGFVFGL